MRPHGASLTGVLLASLLTPAAFAEPPPATSPAAAPPSAAPALSRTSAAAAPRSGPAKPRAPEADPLPPPEVRLWVIAPSPTGPWAFRIDNEGSLPLRIPADVRLLRFEIDTSEGFVAPTEDAKKPKKASKPPKPTVCALPAPLRPGSFPDKSALLLAPGESYIESFDPRLFCFGKNASAALTGGAVVRARFGWDPPKQATKKPPAPPFAVEGTAFPAAVAPLRELSAPTMVLSFAKPKPAPDPKRPVVALVASDPEAPAATPADPKAPPSPAAPAATPADPKAPPGPAAPADASEPSEEKDPALDFLSRPPIVDENAPRLELTASPFLDVSAPARATITVTATNVGHRPMLAAIRPRMLGFRIQGPTGVKRCDAALPTNAVPRDLFSTIKPGKSVSMTVLLSEVCPRDTFARPGLYEVKATLHAGESGAELGISAYTGVVSVKTPTQLRLLSGPEPFYTTGPRAAPIPRPTPKPEADADSAE